MKIKSPEDFQNLKAQGAQFAIRGFWDYSKSKALSKIEALSNGRLKLYFQDSYQNLRTGKNEMDEFVDEIDNNELTVWYLKEKELTYGQIPKVLNGILCNPQKMEKLLRKMYLIGSEIDFLREDFVTGKSISFDMGLNGDILSNILYYHQRVFLYRVSTGIYKIVKKNQSKNNKSSLADILDEIKSLDILDVKSVERINGDINLCQKIQEKSGNLFRNTLTAHFGYKEHSGLVNINEKKGYIEHDIPIIDDSWIDEIKKIESIHRYWHEYIFFIKYPPKQSFPFMPLNLEEYRYNLFLTVTNIENGAVIDFQKD